MTTVTPIQQSPVEDLKNCLQIASAWAESQPPLTANAFVRIAQLIRHALVQLEEPSEATIQRTALLTLGWNLKTHPNENIARKARDTAACVLFAQLSGWGPL